MLCAPLELRMPGMCDIAYVFSAYAFLPATQCKHLLSCVVAMAALLGLVVRA
jgi:hypothetical protein